ncbi:uncharacterized protein LOC132645504 [Lycium barbarum]|uniref:uncharacterized protein LOC132645504 n=1 Tax=Lycium barbarum TaxID=112863 RepID=UPI00293E02FB|nr:uncharacterized protein LOC132645504 [Lycium barbarum]
MEEGTQILEINLISAQSLKTPVANLRRMQTYALLWIDSSTKLRSKIDSFGGENPTWNDKFLFRVTPDFISSDTSGVSVEIYAVGYIKDHLIGTVRLLMSNMYSGISTATPAFTAVQVRRPSGRFHGVLNIAASVYSSTDFTLLNGLTAVCFRDLMQEKENGGKWGRRRRVGSKRSEQSSIGTVGSCDFDYSDGTDSTTSSSSSSSVVSTALTDWNCVRTVMAGKNDLKSSDGGGLLCGLMMQKKIQLRPLDQNSGFWAESFEKEP